MKTIEDINLTELGFIDYVLETKYHIVEYMFHDIGMLKINSKPNLGNDSIYIEDYFDIDNFVNIIFYITGFKIKNTLTKNENYFYCAHKEKDNCIEQCSVCAFRESRGVIKNLNNGK